MSVSVAVCRSQSRTTTGKKAGSLTFELLSDSCIIHKVKLNVMLIYIYILNLLIHVVKYFSSGFNVIVLALNWTSIVNFAQLPVQARALDCQ